MIITRFWMTSWIVMMVLENAFVQRFATFRNLSQLSKLFATSQNRAVHPKMTLICTACKLFNTCIDEVKLSVEITQNYHTSNGSGQSGKCSMKRGG